MTQEFMVVCGPSGSVFVKERSFFVSQGGDTQAWGKHWVKVIANSIEDAREQGCKIFTEARPYERQTK